MYSHFASPWALLDLVHYQIFQEFGKILMLKTPIYHFWEGFERRLFHKNEVF